MPVTMEQVRAALGPDEPDYQGASRLGPEALPHLRELVLSGRPDLASKAASLAGRIGTEGAQEVLETAARSANPVVRVAAAGAAGDLPAEAASALLLGLVVDDDPGVRQVALESALESVAADATPDLRSRVARVGDGDPMPHVRELAKRTLDALSP
jgi:HEAT repeat protein